MYDEEIEKLILYYMIFEKAQYNLSEEDFVKPIHKKIINAINKLKIEKKEISMLTISEKVKHKDILKYLSDLGLYAYGNSLEKIYETIKEYTKKRQMYKMSKDIQTQILSIENGEVNTYIEQVINKLRKVEEQTEKEETFLNQIVKTANSIEKSINRKEDYSFHTSFYDLDTLTDGLHNGELTIIGARPGVGKTTFSLQIAKNIADRNKKVVYVSLEMSEVQIIQKILSRMTRINSKQIRNGQLTEQELEKLSLACGKLSEMKFNILTKTSNIQDIEIVARKMKNNNNLDLLVIDYLQLVRSKSTFRGREQELADISRTLKLLSLELEIPIIALCQLNRNASRTKPTLADIRESGAIEQDADNVIFLYQEGTNENLVTVDLQKQRAGNIGTVKLKFNRLYSEFNNIVRR